MLYPKKNHKASLLLFLALFSQAINGNTLDSLKNLIGNINDTSNYAIYRAIWHEYIDINLDSAMQYAELGIYQAERDKNAFQLGMFYSRKGDILFFMREI